jgi:hypothetical protein
VQEALLQTLDKVRKEPFRPEKGWQAWLYSVARNRARDRLRRVELKLFEDLSSHESSSSGEGWQPSDRGASPSQRAVEGERRSRQGKMLSDILQEWCRHCETSAEGLLHKEFFERLLRGQDYEAIKTVMNDRFSKLGKPGISKNTLYQWRKRAHQWILERVRQTDVNRSVFQTMLGPPSEKKPAVISRPSAARKDGEARGTVQPPNAVPAPAKQLPQVTRFGDVVLWVIEEAGALCPTSERLAEFAAHPKSVEFTDVSYHIREADCRLCSVELELMR